MTSRMFRNATRNVWSRVVTVRDATGPRWVRRSGLVTTAKREVSPVPGQRIVDRPLLSVPLRRALVGLVVWQRRVRIDSLDVGRAAQAGDGRRFRTASLRRPPLVRLVTARLIFDNRPCLRRGSLLQHGVQQGDQGGA